MMNQKTAVECGHWPLYRFNPMAARVGENPMKLDSKPPKVRFEEYASMEARFKMLRQSNPEQARQLASLAQEDIRKRWEMLEHLARNGSGQQKEVTDSAPTAVR